MPLASISKHGAKQCTARSKRSGMQCKNPAAYGCNSCRMHGARKKDSIKRGEQHPNFVHGYRSMEGIRRNHEAMVRIKELARIAKRCGLIK